MDANLYGLIKDFALRTLELLEEPLVWPLHKFRARTLFVQEIIRCWDYAAMLIVHVHVMLRIFFVQVHASGQNVSNSLCIKQTPGNETNKGCDGNNDEDNIS